MEPAAAWAPCEFQLANWTLEEPAAGLPVEYASIAIPAGTCSLQAYVPETSGGQHQQLLEYYNYYYSASAPSQHSATIEQKAKISNDSHARSVANQVMDEFEADIRKTKQKMHRYPACLGSVDESYTMPRIVAIGPYHHGRDHLKEAEKVKHAAACYCVKSSGRLLEELYAAVIPVADSARGLYNTDDVMAGISADDFRHMMFFDACFLVQYMSMYATGTVDQSLMNGFLSPNRGDIFHDVMLLENQLPWKVVETVLRFMPSRSISKRFVASKRHCMLSDDRHEPPPQQKLFIWYESYRPAHLLGLLRYYIVGRSDIEHLRLKNKKIAFSVSAMELAEIGITLTANKTMQLIDMCLNQKTGTLFPELSLAPLSLDRDRASYLVNMAALELCTVKSFGKAPDEDSAVCSYLLLLAKLVYREEDVHELRKKGLLQGGGGLTNEEALRFFTSFQGLRFGPYYLRIMQEIQNYRDSSRIKTKLFAFLHNHKKTIAAVVTGIGAVGGIIGTLLSIKKTF